MSTRTTSPQPRRWDIDNIFKFMVFIGPISSIFDYATFAMMLFVFDAGTMPSLFQTGWFVESLLTQTLIIHIIRTAKIPFIESRASRGADRHDDRHLPSSESRSRSPGSAARLASRPCPGSTGRWWRQCSLSYAMLTQLVKAWFVRRWGM